MRIIMNIIVLHQQLEESCFTDDEFKNDSMLLRNNDTASADATVMSTVLPIVAGRANGSTSIQSPVQHASTPGRWSYHPTYAKLLRWTPPI